jgi:hypothetical protein
MSVVLTRLSDGMIRLRDGMSDVLTRLSDGMVRLRDGLSDVLTAVSTDKKWGGGGSMFIIVKGLRGKFCRKLLSPKRNA